jgi:DNA primase catalytic subunit
MKNIGIKFSGSKGFHILIPWKAFPEEINGEKSKMRTNRKNISNI